MKITIVSRQITVFDEWKALAEKKLQKLEKFFDEESTNATVTFSKHKNKFTVEITIFSAGTVFRCESTENDFRDAIDRAVDVIERQIRRNKTRLEKRMKASFAAAEAAMTEGDAPVEEEGVFEEDEEIVLGNEKGAKAAILAASETAPARKKGTPAVNRKGTGEGEFSKVTSREGEAAETLGAPARKKGTPSIDRAGHTAAHKATGKKILDVQR